MKILSLSTSIRFACQQTGECCWRPVADPSHLYTVGAGIRWLPTPDGGARCEKLGEDGVTCTIWETRPLACRLFPIAAVKNHMAQTWFYQPEIVTQCPACQHDGPERPVSEWMTENGAWPLVARWQHGEDV